MNKLGDQESGSLDVSVGANLFEIALISRNLLFLSTAEGNNGGGSSGGGASQQQQKQQQEAGSQIKTKLAFKVSFFSLNLPARLPSDWLTDWRTDLRDLKQPSRVQKK